MSDCPANTYFSAFVNSCVSCPDDIGNCGKESAADSLSCERSCAGNRYSLQLLALNLVALLILYRFIKLAPYCTNLHDHALPH